MLLGTLPSHLFAVQAGNSLVGYCGDDTNCKNYQSWSQILYDPANRTAGFMGQCIV